MEASSTKKRGKRESNLATLALTSHYSLLFTHYSLSMLLPLFLIPILCGLIAQAIKPLLNKQWYAQISADGKKLPRYGGMPSAHSATAFALVTVVGLHDGLKSTTFLIAVILMIWTLDDALRMRIFLSRHGQALRRLIQKLPKEERGTYPYLEARMGHKPLEVVAGGALGIIASTILYYVFMLGV